MVLIKVNEYEIGEQELVSEVYKLCTDKGLDKPDKEILEIAVNNLIEGHLILNEARRAEIEVTEDEVEKEVLNLMLTFESSDKYNEFLHVLKSSPESLKKHLHVKLTIRKFLEMKRTDHFPCNEKMLKTFYDEHIDSFKIDGVVRVSHILIKPEMGLEKASQIRNNIETSEDFNRVVGCCSNCPSCSQAGDLGYVPKGRMVKEFDDVAFNLNMNEISQPVTTEFGYHIIMLTDKKELVTLPFEEVKDTLKKRLCKIEHELEVVKLINELKEKADIFISDEVWNFSV